MTTFYTISLYLHSWNRWLIIIAGLLSLVFALKGSINKLPYTKSDRYLSLAFIGSLHIQLLLGLLLYFIASPYTTQAMQNFGAAMKDSTLRYWAVEHSTLNVIAIIIAQIGSVIIKRETESADKHRKTLIWTGIAFLIILLMIPFGIMGPDRPWFRF